jgi:hypothetical protein
MERKSFTEHIELIRDEEGKLYLEIDDETLSGFVEEWLERERDLVPDYSFAEEGKETLVFKAPVAFEGLAEALSALDPAMIERVWEGDEEAWAVDPEE